MKIDQKLTKRPGRPEHRTGCLALIRFQEGGLVRLQIKESYPGLRQQSILMSRREAFLLGIELIKTVEVA